MPGDPRLHGLLVGADLRPLADDGDIEVGGFQSAALHPANGFREEVHRIPALVRRIVIGKELPDVGLTHGAQQGIGDGMEHDVTIAVPHRTVTVLHVNTTKHERPACSLRRQRLQAMQVVAVTDEQGGWSR